MKGAFEGLAASTTEYMAFKMSEAKRQKSDDERSQQTLVRVAALESVVANLRTKTDELNTKTDVMSGKMDQSAQGIAENQQGINQILEMLRQKPN